MINSLGNTTTRRSNFIAKNWVGVLGSYNTTSQINFKSTMQKSILLEESMDTYLQKEL